MTFKTSYHSIKSVEPIKSYSDFSKSIIAGNAKNMRNWPSLPRDFSATAWTKNSRWVPKLVLRYVLSENIQLVAF